MYFKKIPNSEDVAAIQIKKFLYFFVRNGTKFDFSIRNARVIFFLHSVEESFC